MKLPELFHAGANIGIVVWVADPGVFYEFCDFISVICVYINYIVTNGFIVYCIVNKGLVFSVNEMFSTFTRDSHYIFLTAAGEKK